MAIKIGMTVKDANFSIDGISLEELLALQALIGPTTGGYLGRLWDEIKETLDNVGYEAEGDGNPFHVDVDTISLMKATGT